MSAGDVTVRVELKGWEKFRDQLPKDLQLAVGILPEAGGGDTAPGTSLTYAALAYLHEFGAAARGARSSIATRETVRGFAGIKERSFLRSTFERSDVLARVNGLALRAVRGVTAGKLTWPQALGQVGAWAAAQVKATIRTKLTVGPEDQANAPSTIARKGSSTPLVDTGGLLGRISWIVRGGAK